MRDKAGQAKENFLAVEGRFAKNRLVTLGGGKGFGSSALKVDGKIFAMRSSKGCFVVKLPRERVDELVSLGGGKHFETAPGRRMKEWVAVQGENSDWVKLAEEAYEYVKQSGRQDA